MKIVTILGSPRLRGNTAAVLRRFEEIVTARGHETDRIDAVKYTLNGCLGCDKCQSVTDKPGCIQKDDMLPLFERIIAADAVVYASPVYVWGFTAQIKPLIDRQYCLVKNYGTDRYKSFIQGKRVALLVTCGGRCGDNADLISSVFKRESDFTGCRIAGMYCVSDCTIPGELGQDAEDAARQMAEDIIGKPGMSVISSG
ncbi:flavodoxin family protein [bacterium]|nr:flavodoxin family protein [bacterium]